MDYFLGGLFLAVVIMVVHELSHAFIARILGHFNGFAMVSFCPATKISSPIENWKYSAIMISGLVGSILFLMALIIFFDFNNYYVEWGLFFVFGFSVLDIYNIFKYANVKVIE